MFAYLLKLKCFEVEYLYLKVFYFRRR